MAELLKNTYYYYNNIMNPENIHLVIEHIKQLDLDDAMVGGDDLIYDKKIRRSKVKLYRHLHTDNLIEQYIAFLCKHCLLEANKNLYNYDLHEDMLSIQLTTYSNKDQGEYDWHTDDSVLTRGDIYNNTRKLSMSLLLNPAISGGEFFLDGGTFDYPQTPGSAIIFPSFMAHKVEKVIIGERISIVAWMEGPIWK